VVDIMISSESLGATTDRAVRLHPDATQLIQSVGEVSVCRDFCLISYLREEAGSTSARL